MSIPYKLSVNDSFEFSKTVDDVEQLDIYKKSNNQYHIIDQHKSFDALVTKSNFDAKRYTVLINDTEYEVQISDALDMQISKMGLQATSSAKENDLKAPMPGLIVSIDVSEGDQVKEGDGLLILEAMKMENTLVAPKDGQISKITVKAGAKVEKNELLIELT